MDMARPPEVRKWVELLERELPRTPTRHLRMNGFYVPLALWIEELKRNQKDIRPLFIGVNAPQGAGKTTLTCFLVKMLNEVGLKAVTVSIDDFYLTHAEQSALAANYPDNPYLQQRGYPGTHDLTLGEKTLEAFSKNQPVLCPVYDKSAHQGLGDRKPRSEWKQIVGPIDVVFLEGWMLGFSPVPRKFLPNSHFEQINLFLAQYSRWDPFLDAFLHLSPKRIEFVVDWRIEAEERMKAEGKPGMTVQQIRTYIETFLPAYETYLPSFLKSLPKMSRPVRILKIDKNRLPPRG